MLAIAVAVAMIFAMLSFGPAVYEYIYSTQTATSGRSDIVISTNSSSDRIISVTEPLLGLEGVDSVTSSLTLYALLDGEYVRLRGFERGAFERLQDIVFTSGNGDTAGGLDENSDNVVISEATAKKYSLGVGDRITLSLGSQKDVPFYVSGIAEESGYFLGDSPSLILGRVEGISRMLTDISAKEICNEIYVKASDGADVDELISRISAMPEYSSMLVKRTGGSYIKEQADSLSAPVVLAGVAVFALSIAVIVLLFMMSEKEKISLISKYTVIGATKKQILGIFMLESVLLACAGAVIGSALAVGVFVGILKLTLSPAVAFTVSAWRLFLSATVGIASAIVSSLLPILRSFRGTVRQNQLSAEKRSRIAVIICPVLIALATVCVAVEFAVPSATAVASVFSLIFTLGALGVCFAPALRLTARAGSKIPSPDVKVASTDIVRDGRFSRSAVMLGVGMTVSMMLFMAWAVTKSVFSDYTADFADMVFVSNVRANADIDEFKAVDGVDGAYKIVWKQGSLTVGKDEKTMNVLGSKYALDIVDFACVTPREQILQALDSDGASVILDKALSVLYGVKEGDVLPMTLDGVTADVRVAGITEHRLFSGNYVLMSEHAIERIFGVHVDTVLLKSQGDVDALVNGLREKFAKNNYYAISVLQAYRWEMQSTDSVFDLIGTLAIVVAVFIFAVTVFASQVGRATGEKGRVALLNAGMSKRALLRSELLEHSLTAVVAYALSFAVSVLLSASLIHALRLFGLYFEFMYEAWVVALVGAVMATGYALLPVALRYKKGYTVKKR